MRRSCHCPSKDSCVFVTYVLLAGSAGSRKRVQRLKIHCVKKPAKKPASSRQVALYSTAVCLKEAWRALWRGIHPHAEPVVTRSKAAVQTLSSF